MKNMKAAIVLALFYLAVSLASRRWPVAEPVDLSQFAFEGEDCHD